MKREREAAFYGVDYAVPDLKMMPDFPSVEVKMVLRKSFPLVGRVVDTKWKGNRHGLSLATALNNDFSLKNPLIERRSEVKIRAYPDHGCWLIMERCCEDWSTTLTIQVWQCYQRIAEHLLTKGSLVGY